MHCTIAFLALVPITPRLVRTRDDGCNHNPMQRLFGLAAAAAAFDFFRIVKEQTAFLDPVRGEE
jgi:hypothetical protein